MGGQSKFRFSTGPVASYERLGKQSTHYTYPFPTFQLKISSILGEYSIKCTYSWIPHLV